MSRHRFVRNIDFDAEMEDDEEDQVMTAEQTAQMKTALPIARTLLSDIKPPISENEIADSLWYYYFDVDKTVTWLRKEWEKKGEEPPESIQPIPSPNGPRRLRKYKRQRLETDAITTADQPPISALQKLSLSRNTGGDAAVESTSSPSATPEPGPSKPLSKLALLAQQRRQAAAGGTTARIPSTSSSNTVASTLTPNPTISAASSSSGSSTPPKPLSKLAQRMAAARAAKAEEVQMGGSDTAPESTAGTSLGQTYDNKSSIPGADELWTDVSSRKRDTEAVPSEFFRILSGTEQTPQPTKVQVDLTWMHLPSGPNRPALIERIQTAFDTPSPDDVVLAARGGRAGTAAIIAGDARPESKPIVPIKADVSSKAPKADTSIKVATGKPKVKPRPQGKKTVKAGQ